MNVTLRMHQSLPGTGAVVASRYPELYHERVKTT
jgi:hypothetical protein